MILAVHLDLEISPQIFGKINNPSVSAVLRIRDFYPGSRILNFTHPGSWIPDPKTATKERGEKN
jgi:hypothetical protein